MRTEPEAISKLSVPLSPCKNLGYRRKIEERKEKKMVKKIFIFDRKKNISVNILQFHHHLQMYIVACMHLNLMVSTNHHCYVDRCSTCVVQKSPSYHHNW